MNSAELYATLWDLRTNPLSPDVDANGHPFDPGLMQDTLDPSRDARVVRYYFDLVSLVPLIRSEESREGAANARGSLIAELRRVARGKRLIDRWLNARLWVWPLIVPVIAFLYYLFGYGIELFQYTREVLFHGASVAVPSSLALTGLVWATTAFVRYWRVRRWELALRRLRRDLESARHST